LTFADGGYHFEAATLLHHHSHFEVPMSSDKAVTKDLMETLADGREGFAQAALKLDDHHPEISEMFRRFSAQRATFYLELDTLARSYGDYVEESGSALATLHRGWMTLKDALTGSSPKGVVDAAEQGEDHAVQAYEKAVNEDISVGLRTVVERQQRDVQAAHDDVRILKSNLARA
jgi:uncharacterized protein (TIGR02284 family)